MSDNICEHNRNREACEDCAYARAKEAGLPLGGPPPAQTREAQEQAAAVAEGTGVTSATTTSGRAARRK